MGSQGWPVRGPDCRHRPSRHGWPVILFRSGKKYDIAPELVVRHQESAKGAETHAKNMVELYKMSRQCTASGVPGDAQALFVG